MQSTAVAPLGCWTLGYTHVLVGRRYTACLILNLVGGQYTALHPSLSKPTTPTAAQKKPQPRIGTERLSRPIVVARGVPFLPPFPIPHRRRSSLCHQFPPLLPFPTPPGPNLLDSNLPSRLFDQGPCFVIISLYTQQITIQQSSNINQITGNSNMERRSKRIQRRIEPGDDSDSSNPPPMESNEGESAASGANPVGPDSTDEQSLEHAMKLAHNQVSSAYASYEAPTMSDQMEKFDWYMVAWKCKT
ncbi:hypothetical protein PGTUg99_033107 [Puccinia graminis f. sp. tritici]|uniref:Uncharacterized protein n=1 Tax=Puccinia graminis f. sp. tritici TaxID=56615 RepID=A0A5B0PJU7_PUCGR|nr:hypothetical protein PGTUg99_033107 [Puccinia graminis f. sp. tritici]